MSSDLQTAFQSALSALDPPLEPSAAQWQRLLPLLRLQRLGPGAVLLAQGAPVPAFYALHRGQIEARFTGLDGAVSVLEHIAPPRIFGLAAFAHGGVSGYEALATRASQVIPIGQAAYALLMDELPGFARALMREFARRHGGTLRQLAASRHAGAAERLGMALQQLRHERGAAAPDAQGWCEIQASQADLAALAHVSRQTVNEWLRQNAAQGRVRLGYRRLWLRGNS